MFMIHIYTAPLFLLLLLLAVEKLEHEEHESLLETTTDEGHNPFLVFGGSVPRMGSPSPN